MPAPIDRDPSRSTPASSLASPELSDSYRSQLTRGKQVKWIKGVEFIANFSDIGGGYGGYNQDHEFFGYRQSL